MATSFYTLLFHFQNQIPKVIKCKKETKAVDTGWLIGNWQL